MEHCKFCQAELPEGSTVCPGCGRDNAEPLEEQTPPVTEPAESAPQELGEAEVDPTADQAPAQEEPQVQPAEDPQTPGPQSAETPPAGEEPLSAPIQEGMKATPGKIALMVAGVVLLAAVLVALVVAGTRGSGEDRLADEPTLAPTAETAQTEPAETTPATVPPDGNPDDVTCKGSYSVSDEEAERTRDVVVATMGDKVLTNAQLRVYYWMEFQGFLSSYGAYASYFGLDYTQPLDTQLSQEEGLTWQQYFLRSALTNWEQVQAMALAAQESGMEIAQENQQLLDSLEDTVAQMAENYGVSTEELLKSNFGPGAGMEEYRNFQALYYQGLPYYTAETAKLVPQEDALWAYFEEHREDYASGGVSEDDLYVDVRHILIQPEGGETGEDGTVTYSDEEWAACQEAAQAVLEEYLAGERTEEAFAALAAEKSQDPGSQSNGGLYQQVYPGQMVEEFDAWCFDSGRQSGDTALVKTSYGYHVMYFVSSQPQWRYFAESDWTMEQTNQLIEDLVSRNPAVIDYSKIALGVVDMAG